MIDSVGSSSTPLTTQVIQRAGGAAQENVVPSQTDPSIVNTPENVNRAVDSAEDRVQDRQQTQQAEQDAVRRLALEVNEYQHQQELIDTYQSQTTGSDETSTSAYSASDLAEYSSSSNQVASNNLQVQEKYLDATVPKEPSNFTIEV